jgi:hypothetical protein
MRCAVLTSSAIARGVVTAIAWLGIPVRSFRPDAWGDIRDYLGLDQQTCREVETALQRMSRIELPKTAARF